MVQFESGTYFTRLTFLHKKNRNLPTQLLIGCGSNRPWVIPSEGLWCSVCGLYCFLLTARQYSASPEGISKHVPFPTGVVHARGNREDIYSPVNSCTTRMFSYRPLQQTVSAVYHNIPIPCSRIRRFPSTYSPTHSPYTSPSLGPQRRDKNCKQLVNVIWLGLDSVTEHQPASCQHYSRFFFDNRAIFTSRKGVINCWIFISK